MITIKFQFNYGNIFSCIWSDSDEAIEKFGGYIIGFDLVGISNKLKTRLTLLCEEYQSSLNWDYPPDPSPWSAEHWSEFKHKAYEAYEDLKKELGNNYNVLYKVN